jgi:hypothetical protein
LPFAAAPALAEPISGEAAQAMLFPPAPAEVVAYRVEAVQGLSEDEIALLTQSTTPP